MAKGKTTTNTIELSDIKVDNDDQTVPQEEIKEEFSIPESISR